MDSVLTSHNGAVSDLTPIAHDHNKESIHLALPLYYRRSAFIITGARPRPFARSRRNLQAPSEVPEGR